MMFRLVTGIEEIDEFNREHNRSRGHHKTIEI